MNELEAITKAISVLGGPTKTAKQLTASMGVPVAQNTVSDWKNKHGRCPERYAWHLQHLTEQAGDKVSAKELCPVAFTIKKKAS